LKKLTWTAECRLGYDEVDAQHRLLFAIANELIDIDNPQKQGPEIKYLLTHLREYVEEHFADEEKFLERVKYPELEDHKKKHAKIVLEIKESLTSSSNLIQLKKRLEDLLENWVKQHILIEDKKYADWAKFHKLEEFK
jgi:hemerythrin